MQIKNNLLQITTVTIHFNVGQWFLTFLGPEAPIHFPVPLPLPSNKIKDNFLPNNNNNYWI